MIGSLNQPQPVNMTLQYFLHTTAQPESCTNELFKQFRTEMSSGQTDVVFDVDIIDSRLDTRQTVYVTSRLMMDGISSPCSRPIPLQITGLAHTASLHLACHLCLHAWQLTLAPDALTLAVYSCIAVYNDHTLAVTQHHILEKVFLYIDNGVHLLHRLNNN